ncbi:hypothetical protein SEA_PHOEBUS_74 [Mycobacterium phage Phoebus]|uniref:hypothetical protein n=1 Tax=Mycobacterium phage Ariel TaxID=1541824 RepID=UPI0004F62E75|nr:hypothetical protein AVT17_gp071 [Mycobacterium phage Ariel]YP_009213289.1 hypothetical protein AVV70_gp072 [Mycobacterium phage MiaZeal]ASD50705.1 hypothetical protein PORCELAIN_71 [Mycobacterium phage Porcelain]ASZ74148.1 hypothetical protein SEA_SQUINT_72 [Mycobacterium phage Squint]QBJ00025.1 hypothetical protein SEA_PHOEBUS_74 [Mycobacterium phage Phoebus]AIM49948.1 hypothetical protein PBI_ARIEL_71 [Mycobacterium phage Ariel]AIY32426.1 hypothetical protein PBI_MIAZEAL_72 [Mycobacteri
MSSEAQNVIADVIGKHRPIDSRDGEDGLCSCGWQEGVRWGPPTCAEHLAEEIDKALGGLRPEYIARHESGGGTIHGTRVNAEIAMRSYVVFPPGVDDPGSGRLTGIESRWVSGWSEA